MRGVLVAALAASALLAGVSSAAKVGEIIATVGPRTITRSMLDDAVQSTLNSSFYHQNVAPERRLILEREQLDALVKRELNALGGMERGLKPPADHARVMRRAIEDKMGRGKYEIALKAAGMTRKDHEQALLTTLLAQQAFARFVTGAVTVTDAEVRQTFDASPQRWLVPESALTEEILLKVPPDALAETWAGRNEEALKLIARIKSGETFADVAAAASEDMYRIKGGNLGWVHRGRLVAALDAAVWSAEPGTLIGPLRSSEGVHVARVAERRGARQMTFEEAASAIRKGLETDRRRATEAAWFAALRAKYPVTVLDVALRGTADGSR